VGTSKNGNAEADVGISEERTETTLDACPRCKTFFDNAEGSLSNVKLNSLMTKYHILLIHRKCAVIFKKEYPFLHNFNEQL